MKRTLQSLTLTTTLALSLSSAIAISLPIFSSPAPAQALRLLAPERPGPASEGQGTLKFRGKTTRILTMMETYRRDDKRTFILTLSDGRTLRLTGKMNANQSTLTMTNGGFNVRGDFDTQADLIGRLTVSTDRTMVTGLQGRLTYDGQPIELQFTRYEQYVGKGSLQFRGQMTIIDRVNYRHWTANQPKTLTLNLRDGRQVTLRGIVREQGDRKTLQVRSGVFTLKPNQPQSNADLTGNLNIVENADGTWRSLNGTLNFDGQPIGIRFLVNAR